MTAEDGDSTVLKDVMDRRHTHKRKLADQIIVNTVSM